MSLDHLNSLPCENNLLCSKGKITKITIMLFVLYKTKIWMDRQGVYLLSGHVEGQQVESVW